MFRSIHDFVGRPEADQPRDAARERPALVKTSG
jgi:hypothetical protein